MVPEGEDLGCNTGVVMVGDQYTTDIAGANLAGIRSIKVATIARHSFPFPVRLLQTMEDMLVRALAVHVIGILQPDGQPYHVLRDAGSHECLGIHA